MLTIDSKGDLFEWDYFYQTPVVFKVMIAEKIKDKICYAGYVNSGKRIAVIHENSRISFYWRNKVETAYHRLKWIRRFKLHPISVVGIDGDADGS